MGKIDSSELVDIFKEEMSKKKKKEVKMKKKLEKKMEKQEDIEFEKMTREEKRKQEERPIAHYKENSKNFPTTLETVPNSPSFFSNVIFGFFSILLLLCTSGYSLFLLHASFDKKNGIKCILLMIFAIFYLLSFIIKKQNTKRFCAIISSMAISLLMVFLIYIS